MCTPQEKLKSSIRNVSRFVGLCTLLKAHKGNREGKEKSLPYDPFNGGEALAQN